MKSLLTILLVAFVWENGLVSGACEGDMLELLPGFCFKYVATVMTPDDATAHCKDEVYDSYLIEVTSTERAELIANTAFFPAGQKWVGLQRIGTVWTWQHSGTIAPIFWQTGDPGDVNTNPRTCAGTAATNETQLSDVFCNFRRSFVCEKAKPTIDIPDCQVGNPDVTNCDLLSKGHCSVPQGFGKFVLTYNCSGTNVSCKHPCRCGVLGPAQCEGIENNGTCTMLATTSCDDGPFGCGIGIYEKIWRCGPGPVIKCPHLCCCGTCTAGSVGVFPRLKTCEDWKKPNIPESVCKNPPCHGPNTYRNVTAPYDCITVT